MPIYEYRACDNGCTHCRDGFDAMQKMADAPLTACPQCGAPVERIMSAPALATGTSHVLKESHFAERGFTQYRKTAKGKYEKTAGKGPDKISSD